MRPLTPASLLWLDRLEEVARRSGWRVERGEPYPGIRELLLSQHGRYVQVLVSPTRGTRDRKTVNRWSPGVPMRKARVRDVFDLARVA